MNDPVLLELFNCLREAGIPLGLEEYYLLLQALHDGFGTKDRHALAQLCCTLWIKSENEKRVFQEYFEQLIPEKTNLRTLPNDTKDNEINYPRDNRKIVKKRESFQINRYLTLGVISFLVIIGSIFALCRNPHPKPNLGILTFRTTIVPFFHHFYIFKENEKAEVWITRTGDSRGKVSATVVIDETDDYPDGYLLEDSTNKTEASKEELALKDCNNLPIIVTFADNEAGVKKITIPIFNDSVFENPERVTLRLINPQGEAKIARNGSTAKFTIADDDLPNFGWLGEVGEWLLIAIAGLLIVLISLERRSVQEETSSPEDYTELPRAMLSPEVIQVMSDEIQVAKAIRQTDNSVEDTFHIIAKDLPVTYRQMKQGWRRLRRLVREGIPSELDLEATIHHIGRQGFLLNPVLTPRRINKIELLLLIDQDGSMVPFHHLSQALIETASQGGRFERVRVYYFHNCPDEYLYKDPFHVEAELIDDCLSQLPKTRVVCLTFSDAGAMRGGFNSRRRRLTKFFLKQLREYTRHIAWLNPVPHPRWKYTTAEEIANLVPMFGIDGQEFYRAIDTLRGRSI